MKTVKRIDVHCHTIEEKGLCRPDGRTFATPEELIGIQDRLGVERGILLPIVNPVGGYDGNTVREIQRIAARYPNRFSWFCNVDACQGRNSKDTDFDRILAYYKELGAVGVGEIVSNLPMDDPRVEALFGACERQKMPIIIHIGAREGDYGLIDGLGLPLLEQTLEKFPKLTVLGHSQKFWAEISGGLTEQERGGYPTGPVKPGGRVVELMRRYPNLHADLSATSGWNAICRDTAFGLAFLEEFQDRVYYGTDICAPSQAEKPFAQLGAWLDQCMLEGKLSDSAYEKICRGNALRLLRGALG